MGPVMVLWLSSAEELKAQLSVYNNNMLDK